ncbi:MAG TPA: hypothetical protein VFI02_16845 [Armatimonadota bacterium]|nr:hypothetical protein [Armatimonadota bacterium]
MSVEEQVKTCRIVKRLTDVQVIASFPHIREPYWIKGAHERAEAYAQELERAVSDFDDFLRDHRSQDIVRLDVERDIKDVCSSCGEEWEEAKEDGVTYCASCGATLAKKKEEARQ